MTERTDRSRGLPRAPALPAIGALARTIVEDEFPVAADSTVSPSWFGRIADAHGRFLSAMDENQSRYLRLHAGFVTKARETPVLANTTEHRVPFGSFGGSPGATVTALSELLPEAPSVGHDNPGSVVVELPNGFPSDEGGATSARHAGSIQVHDRSGAVLACVRAGDPVPAPGAVHPAAEAFERGARVAAAMSAVRSGRLDDVLGRDFAATAAAVRPPAIADVVPATVDTMITLTVSADSAVASARVRLAGRPVVERVVDAAVELGAVLIQASGLTVDHDGWRFDLTAPQVITLIAAQAQGDCVDVQVEATVMPGAELPTRVLRAHATDGDSTCALLDGIVLSLRPDWPEVPGDVVPDPAALGRLPAALEQDGITWDHQQLLASTRERPSMAYGSRFASYDMADRIPRLPGPPLMLMSRIIDARGEPGSRVAGIAVTSAYVVDPDAWYFGDGDDTTTMPMATLMEILLQPCGWLSLYGGFVNTASRPVRFRNLDGRLHLHEPVRRQDAAQVTVMRCTLTDVTQVADTVLLRFSIVATLDGRRLAELGTVFGYFTDVELGHQAQLSAGDRIAADATPLDPLAIDLTCEPNRFFAGTAGLPRGRLRMVDALLAWSPHGGAAGMGRLRAQQWPKANTWYFTSHFFQDPVQPGSLGVEALWQTLKSYALVADLVGPTSTFAPLDGEPLRWKYRGQIQPGAGEVGYDVEITDHISDGDTVTLIARGTLSVDSKPIYRVDGLGLRITSRADAPPTWRRDDVSVKTMPFLTDHRPNHTVPVMPLMGMVEMIAEVVLARHPHRVLAAVEDLQVYRWMPVETAPSLRIVIDEPVGDRVAGRLEIWRTAIPDTLSRYETVAAGTFVLADAFAPPPTPLPPLTAASDVELPYVTGEMFHGPSFQLLRSMQRGYMGATAVADAVGDLPVGAVNPGLLDAALHPIPHDRMQLWFPGADPRHVGYPSRIRRLNFHGPTPRRGDARIEVRAGDRLDGGGRFFSYRIQILEADRVWVDLDIVTVNFRRSHLVDLPAALRRDLMAGERYFPDARLGRPNGDGGWTVRMADLRAANWLPGSVERVFGVEVGAPDVLVQIALKEALAQRTALHPEAFKLRESTAVSPRLPYSRFTVGISSSTAEAATVSVTGEDFDPEGLAAAVAADCPAVDDEAFDSLLRRRFGRIVAPRRRTVLVQPVVIVTNSSAGPWCPVLCRTAAALTGVTVSASVVGIDGAVDASGQLLLARVFPMGEPEQRWDLRYEWVDAADPSGVVAAWHALEPRNAPDEPVADAVADDLDERDRSLVEALR